MSVWNDEGFTYVWSVFGDIYGRRFFDEFGKDIPNAWKATLGEMRRDRVMAALKGLAIDGGEHPPNLPSFIKYANSIKMEPIRAERNLAKLNAPEPKPELSGEQIAENKKRISSMLRSAVNNLKSPK